MVAGADGDVPPRSIRDATSHVRNICVLAHVDHGKTSLTDNLLSASGYIHASHAGRLRYMDSREDEQRRGITMKSSAVVLLHEYTANVESEQFIVNLVDSPGHVDFTGEVEAALDVCDGAILVVDVVEGVCAQTITVLRLALDRGLRPVLVLNKIDRLITELKLDPYDAYRQIEHVLEQVNVILGLRDLQTIIQARDRDFGEASAEDGGASPVASDWKIDEEELEEEDRAFAPEMGNVAFASASDGWAFRLDTFAKLYSKKFGLSEAALRKTLWGDFAINSKTKRIVHLGDRSGKGSSGAKPMFVSFILEKIWAVYESTASSDPESLARREKIVQGLRLKVAERVYKHRDGQVAVKAIMSTWLRAANGLLDMVVERLPSPADAQRSRLDLIWPHARPEDESEVDNWKCVRSAIENCDTREEAPTVAYVSKMISKARDENEGKIRQPKPRPQVEQPSGGTAVSNDVQHETEDAHTNEDQADIEPLIAFCRVLSGTLKVGDLIHVYGPRYTRGGDRGHATATVKQLLLLMGRDMKSVEKVAAGSICGVGGLDEVVLKTATLMDAPPETALPLTSRVGRTMGISQLVVRVALEPNTPMELERLQAGLRKLNQADPMVDTYVMATGESVLAVTGELHLERCLLDLREKFAKGVRFHVSKPIIAFRETVSAEGKAISLATSNKYVTISLRASPMPIALASYIEKHTAGIRAMFFEAQKTDHIVASPQVEDELVELRSVLEAEPSLAAGMRRRLWSAGPRSFGPNLLLGPRNAAPSVLRGITACQGVFFPNLVTSQRTDDPDSPAFGSDIASSIISGFQNATASGPLCEEPVQGVIFSVEDIVFNEEHAPPSDGSDPFGPLSGQIISTVKEACRQAIMAASPRLMEGVLRLEIQIAMEFLGSMYSVISKCRGRITKEELREGASIFQVEALIPVTESFGFAEVLRNQTSGRASPQMILSHWEALEQDPMWEPQTEEEFEDWSLEDKTVANNNLAAKLVTRTRRRKGLRVEDKVVEKAEKQRTLKRNK